MVEISICICTFRRPQLLARLLNAIRMQDIQDVTLQIIVVDNDPAHSAQSELQKQLTLFGGRLMYIHLPVSNISLARNAAIDAAHGEWICMVDDDEYPRSSWLRELKSAQLSYQADVVFAPVLPEYDASTPDWVRRGGYFERRRLPNGTVIDHHDARSGNVLVRRSVLLAQAQNGAVFDPAFGRTGGEDSVLFRRLDMAGAKMIWCDDAPVFESVPAERATRKWLLQRSFRTGQLFMRTELLMTPAAQRPLRACWLALRAIVQALIGMLCVVLFILLAPQRAFSWARIVASQFGKLNHFAGKVPEAYGGAESS
ncbi:glycosyltransferase family 2 protein [Undibacterium sp. CY7W]|uniref:Glycosyltransferase family 2 protein n=1 Tax=Undibacterium rugosum TaxID=2762291 RepID=A0A923I038_9BURK|nr:glycosyltransferase family 2 protein [Undibacterium rugosum]MBC3935363.1 glycosyltransferase family 2 protein [Undibacterium rugosum]